MGVDPTKLIAFKSWCLMSLSTAILSPCITLMTPSGSPASLSHSAISIEAEGSRSDG